MSPVFKEPEHISPVAKRELDAAAKTLGIQTNLALDAFVGKLRDKIV